MDEMFSYLISYVEELQTLEIRNIMIDCQEQEDKAGYRFWHEIVPHHQSSLKVLCIYPWFEGEWCYGPEAAAALSQCVCCCAILLLPAVVLGQLGLKQNYPSREQTK